MGVRCDGLIQGHTNSVSEEPVAGPLLGHPSPTPRLGSVFTSGPEYINSTSDQTGLNLHLDINSSHQLSGALCIHHLI